ncbi:MAG: 50S ribosomal protein L6 [Candidatus Omnitrophica bacterium]|nr:50S ribosomal protein L6 [Candidatus Omnitrophota bacterium]
MSRIGKKPLIIPKDVKIETRDGVIFVEGPKGKLSHKLSDRIELEFKDNLLYVKRKQDTKQDRAMHGLWRALINNMVKGVTEGYMKELEIVGVGYKASVKENILVLQLGFSHPVNFAIPEGIKIETPKPTQIILKGIDKGKLGEIASEIRSINPPEPYKGKGIRFAGEYVKKKVGKAQATSK